MQIASIYGAPPREYGNYNFGFGVSRSKQYKVVWISQSECRVYTLGTTGQWRSITLSRPGLLYNKWNTECVLVGGNLYWLDPPESQTQNEISCFDLETEVFTYFSAPLPRGDLRRDCYRSLCVLDDCLCLCDVYGDEIEIWLMRGQRNWSKKLVINEHGFGRSCGCGYGYLFPIKVLEDNINGNVSGMLLGTRSGATPPYTTTRTITTITITVGEVKGGSDVYIPNALDARDMTFFRSKPCSWTWMRTFAHFD